MNKYYSYKKKSKLIEYVQSISKISKGEMKEYHEWFLRNSQIYIKIDKVESKKLSKKSIIKECFNNCFKLAYGHNLEYIEGYTMSIIPIEHAFLINNNNEVVDPTLAIDTDFSKDRYGSEYIGIKIPNNILLEIRADTKKYDLYLPTLYHYFKIVKGENITAFNESTKIYKQCSRREVRK